MDHSYGLEMSLLQQMDAVDAQYKGNVLAMIYAGAIVGIMCLVSFVYFNRGIFVIGRVLAYLLSLSTMTLAVKSVYVNHGFNFPKFVSGCHFMCCGFFCFGYMMYQRLTAGKPIAVPSLHQEVFVIAPIAITFALSVAANNIALLHSNAAFAEMVGAAAPLCVICINLVQGKGFDLRLLCPVLVVIVGVCVCASGELNFTLFGFSLIFLATFLRAMKTTLQHSIMHDDTGGQKLEPIELLAWMSPACLALVLVWGLVTDGLEPFRQLAGPQWLSLTFAIGLTCVNAVVLNVAGTYVIKDLGPVGSLLASQLKGILLLLGAMVMLGEIIQFQQLAGYLFIAGGIYWYNTKEKEYKDAKVSDQEKVPLTK